MADGKVKIDIELQKRNFEKQLREIESKSESSGNRIASTFKKIAGKLALGKLSADFLRAGISFNSTMETYTANFRVMLGSQEKATKKVQELKEMAAKTPFEMSDLAEATQTLLSFQVPAEQTQTVLKQLGDISLGNSEKLRGLALVFGQVSSAGKLTGQDLLQFINQGFNPLNYIAKRTGESMEELRDRMSKGGISAQEVAQSFEDATSKGGQFYKGMEEGSKTFEGQISTMKDNFNEFAGAVTKPIFDYLANKGIPNMIKLLDFLSEHIKAVQTSLVTLGSIYIGYKSVQLLGGAWGKALTNLALYLNGEAKLKASSAIVGQLTGRVNLLQMALTKVKAVKEALFINKMVGQVALVSAKMKVATIATTAWSKAMALLPIAKYALAGGAVLGLGIAFGIAAKKAGGVDNLLQIIGEKIGSLVEVIATNVPKFIEAGVQIIQSILAGIQIAVPKIIEFLSAQLPQMIETGSNMLVSLMDGFTAQLPYLIEAGTNIIVQFIDNITAHIPMIVDAGIRIINNLANGVITNLPKIINAGIQIISSLVKAIVNNLPRIISMGIRLIVTLANTLIKNLPKIAMATLKIILALTGAIIRNLPKIIAAAVRIVVTLATAIIRNLPKIITAGGRLLQAVVTGIIRVIGKLLTTGGQIVSKLWSGISSKVGWLGNMVTNFAKNIPTYVKNGIGSIVEVGAQLVAGIWEGITSKIGWLKNQISSGMASIKDHFMKVFDIHSPSKWAEKVLGFNIMYGFGKGVAEKIGFVKGEIKGAYDEINDSIDIPDIPKPNVPVGGGAVSNSTNYDNRSVVQNFYNKQTTPYEAYRRVGEVFVY